MVLWDALYENALLPSCTSPHPQVPIPLRRGSDVPAPVSTLVPPPLPRQRPTVSSSGPPTTSAAATAADNATLLVRSASLEKAIPTASGGAELEGRTVISRSYSELDKTDTNEEMLGCGRHTRVGSDPPSTREFRLSVSDTFFVNT